MGARERGFVAAKRIKGLLKTAQTEAAKAWVAQMAERLRIPPEAPMKNAPAKKKASAKTATVRKTATKKAAAPAT
jgi:hypothetical protein